MQVRRRVMMSVAAMTLAACATHEEPAAPPAPATSSGLPAPTPANVTTRIGADQNGRTVDVAIGQRFAVELVGVPTAGYVWAAKTVPAFLTAGGETSGADQPKPSANPALPAAIIGRCSHSPPHERARAIWCWNSVAPGKPTSQQPRPSGSRSGRAKRPLV